MSAHTQNPSWSYPIALFEAFGIEMEYMIVDRETLDVRPVCDELFRIATGEVVSDVEPDGPDGSISWSNELALHVVELKTQRPTPTLEGLAENFQSGVQRIDALLEPMGCRLLPTAMHPWMDPDRETRLWPHEYNDIYRVYDRVFGCRGHGWGNLQSTHINLPFANEDEFGRLLAALRVVLPLLPAIAASSPIVDGKRSGLACTRLEVYRTNSARVPMMAGLVVPEPVFTRSGFEEQILARLYEQLEPHDPQGLLRHEFANARGAMARFDRGAIEIRVLDIQECPKADIAIAALITELVRGLVDERWISSQDQRAIPTEALHAVLLDTIRSGERTQISDRAVLDAFGIGSDNASAGVIWNEILDRVLPDHPVWTPLLRRMLNAGTLSTRIAGQLRAAPSKSELREIYRELAECLHHGELYRVP